MKADLHIHSIFSDGLYNPVELIDMAKENHVDLISITDHDSIEAYQTDYEFPILKGVELSTYYEATPIHLLGYFPNGIKHQKQLEQYFAKVKKQRIKRAEEILKRLKKFYQIELTIQDLIKTADGVITRPTITQAIMKKYDYKEREIYTQMIGDNCPAYVPINKLSTKEGIECLKKHGAIVVLAHPKFIKNIPLETFIELGIDGIEINYPNFSKKYQKKLLNLAQKHHLYVTGGTDFHGNQKNGASIGDTFIYFEKETEILKRVG